MINGLVYQEDVLTVAIIFLCIYISNHHIVPLKHVEFQLKRTNLENERRHTMLNIVTPNNGGITEHEAKPDKTESRNRHR